MGLLDELEKKAEKKQQLIEGQDLRDKQRDELYKSMFRPKFQFIYDYLGKFCNSINYLGEGDPWKFKMKSWCTVDYRVQADYKVKIGSSAQGKNINLTCNSKTLRSVEIEVEGAAKVERFQKLLQHNQVQHTFDGKRDAKLIVVGGRFVISGNLPHRLSIDADYGAKSLIFSFQNFLEVGERKKSIPIDKIDEKQLDDIGQHLRFGESNLFSEILGERERHEIQLRLRKEEQLRQRELVEAEKNRIDDERHARLDSPLPKFFDRIKKDSLLHKFMSKIRQLKK